MRLTVLISAAASASPRKVGTTTPKKEFPPGIDLAIKHKDRCAISIQI
jgi:hypothetical protein